ncbi:MAG: RWP-RK domain-containing protein, partial [Promethearchaeia archaeon]
MKATGQQRAQREFLQRRERDEFDALNLREHDQRFQPFQNSAGNCSADIFFLNCGDKSPQMADALGSLCASLSGTSMIFDVSLCHTALEAAQDPGSSYASTCASGEWQIGSTPLSSGAWHLIETPRAKNDHALEPNSSKSDISPSDDGETTGADAHIPETSYLVSSHDVPAGSATSYPSYDDKSSVHSANAADIPETSNLFSSAQWFDFPSVETGTQVLMQVKPRLLRRNAGPGSKHSLGGRPHVVDDDDLRPLFITPEVLRACFGLPLHEAARKLGICATAVKKCCRKLGISNWPFRRLRPIQARLAK